MNSTSIQRSVFAVISIFLITVLPIRAQVVINEIDYDQPGTDDFEFIELKNTGVSLVNLDTFYLELYNSGTQTVYEFIDLPSSVLAPGEYFVVCGNSSNVTTCDYQVSPSTDLIQNGPADAVALFHVTNDTTAYPVTNSGSSDYLFAGILADPTIPLERGKTYVVNINAPGHPFWVKTAPTTGTGDQYNDGVTNNGAAVGTITFMVPFDAPDTLYYQCEFHAAMTGMLLISNAYSDALSYDGNAGAPYVEGTAFSGADNNSDDYLGVSRFPDGSDTDNNEVDFSLRCITPGAANSADNTGCLSPYSTAGDDCSNPIVVSSLPYTTTDNTSNYTDFYSSSPGATGCGTTSSYLGGNDVVYSYTPTADAYVNISMDPVATYAGLFVYTSCSDIGTQCATGGVNSSSSAAIELNNLQVVNGQTYYLVISTWPSPQTTGYTLDITEVACPDPYGLGSQDITENTATVYWSTLTGAVSYIVEYDTAGFTPGTGSFMAPTDTFSNLSGLVGATEYEFYVTQVCGSNPGDTSATVGPVSFVTACSVFAFPFFEDFESGSPSLNCWTQDITSAGWLTTTLRAYSGTQSFYHNDNSGAQSDRLISPAINLTGAVSPELVFWENVNYLGSMVNHDVAVSTDGGSTWSAPIYDSLLAVEDNWVEVVLDLSAYVGQTVNIGFLYEGDYSDEWYIDDFELREAPQCEAPTALTILGLNSSAAVVGWTSGAGSVSYIVEYDTAGFTPGTGAVIATADTFTSFSGLIDNTDYEFYVTQVCGTNPGDTTAATGPEAFTTLCVGFTAPYSQNFDMSGGNVIPDNGPLPDCWSGIIVNTSGTASLEVDAANNAGAPTTLISSPNFIELTTDDVGDTVVLVSPEFIDLSTDKRIRFYARRDDHLGDLFIGTMTDPNDLSTFTIYDTILNSELLENAWTEFTVNFYAYAGGTAHIAFLQLEPNAFSDTYIDNFVYEVTPLCEQPTDLAAFDLSLTGATLSWNESSSSAASYILEYDTAGFTLGNGNVSTSTDTFSILSGLTSGVNYEFYVTQVCSANPGDTSNPVGPFAFSTLKLGDNCDVPIVVGSLPYTTSDSTGNYNDFYDGSPGSTCGSTSSYLGGNDVVYSYTPGADGLIDILLDSVGTWTGIFIYEDCADIGNTCATGNVNGNTSDPIEFESFPVVVGQTYYIVISTWPTPQATSYSLSITEVLCPAPVALSTQDVSGSEATLYWTSLLGGVSYMVEYDTAGFTLGQGTVMTTVDTFLTLTGLDATTDYEFYVTQVCGTNPGDTTAAVGPQGFTTLCNLTVASFPWTETFEDTSSYRPCWTNEYVAGTSDWTYALGSSGGTITTAYSGALNARFVSLSGTNSPATKLVSPVMDLSSLTNPQLEFYYGQEDWSGDQNTLHVFYRVSLSDPWVLIQDYTGNVASWTMESLYLPNPSSTYQLAFEGRNNWGRANVLDNVTVKEGPACNAPTSLSSQDVTANSATARWTSGPGAVAYIVEYDTAGFALGDGIVVATTDTFTLFSGLNSNTNYEFYVTQVCGVNPGDTTTAAGPEAFSTECLPFTAPYSENFDDPSSVTGDFGAQFCWTTVGNSASQIDLAANESINTDLPPTMPNKIIFNDADLLAGDTALLVSPQFTDLPTYNNRVRFQVAFENAASLLYVGVMSDPSDPSTFVVLDTLSNAPGQVLQEWAEVIINLDNAAKIGSSQYFAIANGGDLYESTVDLFLYEAIPSCASASALTTSSITQTDATLSWTSGGSAASYIIEYDTAGFSLGSGNLLATTDTFDVLTGLVSNTTYDFYVTQVCGVNPGDTSYTTGPVSFTTLCGTFTAPYSENFDDPSSVVGDFGAQFCWTTIGNSASQIDLAANESVNTVLPPTMPNKIIFNDADLLAGDTALLVSPQFTDLPTYGNRVRFQVAFENAASLLYVGVMSDPSDPSTFVVLDTLSNASGQVLQQWAEVVINLDNAAKIGSSQYFAIANGGDLYESTVDLFIYEEIPSCLNPTALTASSVGANQATVSWTDGGGAVSYIIEYDTTGFSLGSGNLVTTTDTFDVLTGLLENTVYDFYVTQVCGVNPGDTSLTTGPVSFITPCNVFPFPFLEDFETGSPSLDCWRQTVTGAGWQLTTLEAYSGVQSAYHNDDSGLQFDRLISPAIDLSTAVNPELVFWERQNFDTWYVNHEVAISTDGGVTWNPPIYSQVGVEDTWVELIFDVSAYVGQTINVGFLYEGDFADEWYLDDFELREAPPCGKPTDFLSQDITASGATVYWTSNGTAASFILEYDTAGFTLGQGTMHTTTDTFFVLSGLDSETDYDVYVTQVCGTNPGDTSVVVGPLSLRTLCVAPVITSYPYTENFDGVSSPTLPCGWIAENTNGDLYTWETGTLVTPNSAPNAVNIRWNATQAMDDWVFTPELVFAGGNQSYDLTFSYTNNSGFYFEKLEVYYGTGQSSADMTTQLFDDANVQYSSVYQTVTVSFIPPGAGSYYIGFHGYSDADQFSLAFDDFVLDLSYVCSTVDAGMNDTICAGDTSTLTALASSSGGTYLWTPGGDTTASIDVTPMVATEYIVTYTDTNNCFDSDTVTVVVKSVPMAEAGLNDTVCLGESSFLTATGGVGYEWSNSAMTDTTTVTPMSTTDYFVTVTGANGCSSTDSVTVVIKALPVADAGLNDTVCLGESSFFRATGGVGYEWSNSAMTDTTTVSPMTTTDYYVTVTGVNSCSSTDTVTVVVNPLPLADAGMNDTICLGDTTTFTASGGVDYLWSTGDTSSSIDVSPTVYTEYDVLVTDANGCSATDSVYVVVNSLPVADAGSDEVICDGDDVTLTASGGGDYLWSTGEMTASVTVSPNATTEYEVLVTDANGCSDLDTVEVVVNAMPVASAGVDTNVCAGSSVTLTATGGANYEWSTGDMAASVSVSPAMDTTYSVTVTTASGCSDVASVYVEVLELPIVRFIQVDSAYCVGEGNVLLVASPPGGSFSGDGVSGNMLDLNDVGAGNTSTITFTYQATNGCFNSVDMDVFVDACPGIDEIDFLSEVQLMPNPFTDRLILRFNAERNDKLLVSLTDMTGKQIWGEIKQVFNGTNTFELNTGDLLSEGIYFVTISSDDNAMTFKVIKTTK